MISALINGSISSPFRQILRHLSRLCAGTSVRFRSKAISVCRSRLSLRHRISGSIPDAGHLIMSTSPALHISASPGFTRWLARNRTSLAFNIYQAGSSF